MAHPATKRCTGGIERSMNFLRGRPDLRKPGRPSRGSLPKFSGRFPSALQRAAGLRMEKTTMATQAPNAAPLPLLYGGLDALNSGQHSKMKLKKSYVLPEVGMTHAV